MPHTSTLAGSVAIVTGASSGFGRAFATALAAENVTVVATGRRSDRLDGLAREVEGIVPWACDVTDETACRTLVDGCLERFSRIDALVNNAGTTNVEPAEQEQPATFRAVLDVNLIAAFTMSHLVAPSMLERGAGSIVNVASIAGLVGIGRMPQAAYAASKSGLIGLTRELAAQWARRGIRVNALAPGFFPTEMTHELFEQGRGRDWVERLTPMGRGGEMSEITGGLMYLLDPTNAYTTGVVLPVDGGWTAI